ncbi:polymorphic toxin type 44 domain-containing protein [Gorillibacterium timonense]|uniref:polymorphic toxin type 44 domain-containing protein n=1 Tax=Gorillibacterium timonense TaxID=1689269 RepID=UPI00071D5771|nr:polymorphic toxin type 44 domain-containing protein [Gorillibacterium timonense]
MKKLIYITLMFLLLFTAFTSFASANEGVTSATEPTDQELQSIHSTLIELNLLQVDESGKIVIAEINPKEVGLQESTYNLYIERMNDANIAVSKGYAYFDETYSFVTRSRDEIIATEFQRDMEKQSFSSLMSGPSILDAYHIALGNRDFIQSIYQSYSKFPGTPASAYIIASSVWVAKVRGGGEWDYKVQPGYAPHDKGWLAITRWGQSYRTSEWFGNYNYGFTGSFLFSLPILYSGGDGAGFIWGDGFDSPEDRQAISQGFTESL